MTYSVWGVWGVWGVYNKTVTLTKTVQQQQQQIFLQLLMVYTILYLMCQPFLNIFR